MISYNKQVFWFNSARILYKPGYNICSIIASIAIPQCQNLCNRMRLHFNGVRHPHIQPLTQRSETPKSEPRSQPVTRRRVRYIPELKLKLKQLCIDNQDRYLEMSSIDEFFRFIRIQFAILARLGQGVRDGIQLRQKVKA